MVMKTQNKSSVKKQHNLTSVESGLENFSDTDENAVIGDKEGGICSYDTDIQIFSDPLGMATEHSSLKKPLEVLQPKIINRPQTMFFNRNYLADRPNEESKSSKPEIKSKPMINKQVV